MKLKINMKDSNREVVLDALSRIIDPLLDLVFDARISVNELNSLVKFRAVNAAKRRAVSNMTRISKSQIAIKTGVPRYEITRLLSSDFESVAASANHPIRRVLDAWNTDKEYRDTTGKPKELVIFGKRLSFERLVAQNTAGLPVRAMLDELLENEAVEIVDKEHVRLLSRFPNMVAFNAASISLLSERVADLISTQIKAFGQRGNPNSVDGNLSVDNLGKSSRKVVKRKNFQRTSPQRE